MDCCGLKRFCGDFAERLRQTPRVADRPRVGGSVPTDIGQRKSVNSSALRTLEDLHELKCPPDPGERATPGRRSGAGKSAKSNALRTLEVFRQLDRTPDPGRRTSGRGRSGPWRIWGK